MSTAVESLLANLPLSVNNVSGLLLFAGIALLLANNDIEIAFSR